MPAEEPLLTPLVIAGLVLAGIFTVVLWFLWWKGRQFAPGDVFRASRFTSGNRLFPTQVLITPASIVHHTPQWVGRREHSIHMAHVASVTIDTNVLFSTLYIETSGGTTPIACRGHHKKDAVRMKDLIEGYQTAYYRANPKPAPGPGGPIS